MNRINYKVLRFIISSRSVYKPSIILWRNAHRHFTLFPNTVFSHALQKLKNSARINLNSLLYKRNFCSDSSDDGKKREPAMLMKFKPVLKPEIILTIKNWIFAKLIIQPYFENEFTLKDFTNGSKQALVIVSQLLSEGDFQSLKGLVSDEALTEIKSNYSAFNLKERQDLLVKLTDILFAFPYQVGIFIDDITQKRFAEILVVYHCLNDFEELRSQGKAFTNELKDDLKVINYRFIREYTKGAQSDWTINRLGHFKLGNLEVK